MKSYFDEEGKSVLFEGKEAEHMVLSTLNKRHQVSKAVDKYRFSFQHLVWISKIHKTSSTVQIFADRNCII